MTTVTIEWEVKVTEKHRVVFTDGDDIGGFASMQDLAVAAFATRPDSDIIDEVGETKLLGLLTAIDSPTQPVPDVIEDRYVTGVHITPKGTV